MKIYLSGGMAGLTFEEMSKWRNEVKAKLSGKETLGSDEQVIDHMGDFSFYDPVRRNYSQVAYDNSGIYKRMSEIVNLDYLDIAGSDVLLALANKPSWGTAMEIHQAFMSGKIVVIISEDPKLSPWVIYHSHKVVASIDEAVAFIWELQKEFPNGYPK